MTRGSACALRCNPVYIYPCVTLCTPVYPCVPLFTPVYPCVPCCNPVCVHPCVCTLLCTPVYPCVPLCTPVYLCVPLCTPVFPVSLVYSCVFLCILVYSCVPLCVPLCTPVYPCVLLCTPVYPWLRNINDSVNTSYDTYSRFTHFPWSEGDSETGFELFRVNALTTRGSLGSAALKARRNWQSDDLMSTPPGQLRTPCARLGAPQSVATS
jgi:hypothetical protein